MRRILPLLFFLLLAACGDDSAPDGENSGIVNIETGPNVEEVDDVELVVSRDATYDWTKRDVTYAQGLVHVEWHSEATTTVDLGATIWEPVGADGTRPALLIVHGGGFIFGDREQPELVEFAEYFTARGYVVVSISYRVLPDRPSMPVEWGEDIDAADGYNNLEKTLGRVMYGATRDAKAAVRYMQANAEELRIDPDRIAAMGGSAGSFISVGLGATEPSDFRDELLGIDPTLDSTNLDESGRIVAVLDYWGGAQVVTAYELVYESGRWDEDDAPIQIVHGTADTTVEFSAAEELRAIYDETGVPYAFHAVADAGHGPWEAMVDGKNLRELGFDFLVEHQGLIVE